MHPEKQNNNEQLIFIIGFSIVSAAFNRLPIFAEYNKIIISGLLGATGAALGMLLHKQVANRSNLIKYGSLAVCFVCILALALFMKSYYKKKEFSEKKNPLEQFVHTFSTSVANEMMERPIDTAAIKPPILSKAEYAQLITCEICGYIALHPDSTHCHYCKSEPFEHIGYKHNNRKEWLREQQRMWFVPDDSTNEVDFYSPKEDYGYKKDPSWKPTITEAEVQKLWE